MTCDSKKNPSMVWDIPQDSFGVFRDLDDIFNQDTQVFLDNVEDEPFKLIIDLLTSQERQQELCRLELIKLLELYKVCDYLQIEELQNLVAKEIATRMNAMSMAQLQDVIHLI